MPETVMKVKASQPLLAEPRDDSDQVVLDGVPLRVFGGEKVKTGTKDSATEQVGDNLIHWVFVEAMTGANLDKRKGFVDDNFLVVEATDVPVILGFTPFPTEVDREDFATTCYLQAALNATNPAYLYALAFVLSGDQWSATDVKTNDPPDAPAVGVYRFPKDTWQSLIATPEGAGILPEQIKFPDVQCIMAAIVAARAADLLSASIADRGVSAVDLFLAHLCAGTKGFGSVAAAMVIQAGRINNTQSAETVFTAIYPDAAVRAAFFARNASIFGANGSATIQQVLANCTTKMGAGFDEVRRLAGEADSDVFGDGIPTTPTDPVTGGVGAVGGLVTNVLTGESNGIDRRQFLDELKRPDIVKKLADMVKGEVGWSAPHDTKMVQLETPFNRAMARGHSLAQALLSTSEDRDRGYYQGGSNGTYSRPVTAAEFEDFKKNFLSDIVAGSNRSEALLGFVATGNASPPTSTAQFAKGTRGADLPTAVPGHPESYFLEGPFRKPFKKLQGGEAISLTLGSSHLASAALSLQGEPPEQMDGDTEGSGPVGGKFNEPAGTSMAPPNERQTITLSNGEKVTINKVIAPQFLGFFNDLIKFGAPVRSLGGFGVRGNPSEHPRGFAIDWAQHSRDVVDADVRRWIDGHRDLLRKLEQRWGLSGGENWQHPDTGHFSIERIFGEAHLKASREASARG
ncbi:hypothetical protein ACU4GH_23785 [Bradyrhizobium betae]